MKRVLSTQIVIMLYLSSVFCQEFKSDELHFSIILPDIQTWEIEYIGDLSCEGMSNPITGYIFSSKNIFKDVSLQIIPVREEILVYNNQFQESYKRGFMQQIPPGLTIISEINSTIDNMPCYDITLMGSMEVEPNIESIYSRNIIIYIDKNMYSLSAMTSDTSTQCKEEIYNILYSFKYIE